MTVMAKTPGPAYICAQCTRAQLLLSRRQLRSSPVTLPRRWQATRAPGLDSTTTDRPETAASNKTSENDSSDKPKNADHDPTAKATTTSPPPREPGAMSQRLLEATEEALMTGGRAGRKAVEEAGFSEELKERLFARVQDAKFRAENAAAFAEAEMPAHASGDRNTFASAAGDAAWTGTEATEDAVRRMLNDAHKPLVQRGSGGKPRYPDLQPVELRIRPGSQMSAAQKAANARERASVYTGLGIKDKKDNALTDEERAARTAEFRERFKPAGRTMPATLTGLASLANERIEDAIARGQFKNIPRGPGIERDRRADNPFIDTTEYIMNKMIKQQNIAPPWIEKQQELSKAVHVFRTRMRNDWRRHAARSIASRGGSLEEQMRIARRYALAEEIHNPAAIKKSSLDEETTAAPADEIAKTPTMAKVHQQLSNEMAEEIGSTLDPTSQSTNDTATANSATPKVPPPEEGEGEEEDIMPLSAPFRDPAWLSLEKSYMELSIANINGLTRAYNLMAPELAKKPYHSLERELNQCYAEVAPDLADMIRERATRPPKKADVAAAPRAPGILDRFGTPTSSRVYDSKEPNYGFKEMWRDLFKGGEATK
ncbi:DnaJ subfamily C member 28-like protein [Microdochium nivale]|nr:DnaJ subfamily C member 28-like protein [Microdochium nivale]